LLENTNRVQLLQKVIITSLARMAYVIPTTVTIGMIQAWQQRGSP
jgi:hypothetical protein